MDPLARFSPSICDFMLGSPEKIGPRIYLLGKQFLVFACLSFEGFFLFTRVGQISASLSSPLFDFFISHKLSHFFLFCILALFEDSSALSPFHSILCWSFPFFVSPPAVFFFFVGLLFL